MSAINRRGVTKALGAAVFGGASAVVAAPSTKACATDPVALLWAKTQSLDAEWVRVSTEQEALRKLIVGRRPAQPNGANFDDWHKGDPDLPRCKALLDQSAELGYQTCDLYDKITVAVATTPDGIRAKAAAALSLWVQDKYLAENMWYYDLILNALREAAAGSAEI